MGALVNLHAVHTYSGAIIQRAHKVTSDLLDRQLPSKRNLKHQLPFSCRDVAASTCPACLLFHDSQSLRIQIAARQNECGKAATT